MIFVTVGTHEQQFNRLVEYIDVWASKHDEEVIIQFGFSTYVPKFCASKQFFPYNEMNENVKRARIIITHGGPSSFIMPLQFGKVPIVVPRRFDFDEHVNNHQVDFCNAVAERQGNIIVVTNIDDLGTIIEKYDSIVESLTNRLVSNNERFCSEFSKLVDGLTSNSNNR